jgi:hypothetical protein
MSDSQYSEYLSRLSTIHLMLNIYIKYIGRKINPNDPMNQ